MKPLLQCKLQFYTEKAADLSITMIFKVALSRKTLNTKF